ncbi:hypothetical protein AVEN_101665-1 [Araneus ventricosus]|uniref:Uncharacterized protein n=1 Tax=Araneus ventricosus TaxID=182803 RepID=A0A4Y2GJ63_ARAVE|nr:hypothetical protein AVEN_101665-1 [Araneus ventricosus]
MQIDNPPSEDATNDLKITNEIVSPPTNSFSEPIPIDDIPNNKIGNEFEYSVTEDTIHNFPNEVIEGTSPVVEHQQPVANLASSE